MTWQYAQHLTHPACPMKPPKSAPVREYRNRPTTSRFRRRPEVFSREDGHGASSTLALASVGDLPNQFVQPPIVQARWIISLLGVNQPQMEDTKPGCLWTIVVIAFWILVALALIKYVFGCYVVSHSNKFTRRWSFSEIESAVAVPEGATTGIW